MTTAAEMERRLEELRCERNTAEEAVAATRQAIARALVDNAAPAEVSKRRKGQAEAAAQLAALEEAVSLAEDEVCRLRTQEAAKAEAAAREADLAEMARIAETLPRIAGHLDEVLALVESITPPASMRRHDMFGALGAAFRAAVQRSNAGKPASVRPALEELAAGWRRNVERRARALVAAGEATAGNDSPLPRDTAIYATQRFTYSDAKERGVARISVPVGALLLIPRAVAARAVAEDVGKLIPTKPGVRMLFKQPHRTASGLVFQQGGEALVSVEDAAALPPGVAEPLGRLLAAEVAELRKEYREREQHGVWHDLGIFNAGDESTGREQCDEVALGEPQAPLAHLAHLDTALGEIDRDAAA